MQVPVYTAYPLNRDTAQRDIDAYEVPAGSCRVVLARQGAMLSTIDAQADKGNATAASSSGAYSLGVLHSMASCKGNLHVQLPMVFLGRDAQSTFWYAAEAAEGTEAASFSGKVHPPDWLTSEAGKSKNSATQHADLAWVDVRKNGAEFAAPDSAVAAAAVGLMAWHRANKVSPVTGAPLTVGQGGWALQGTDSATSTQYPRIDPAIIVLVTCGDFALLGHNAKWPEGRHSALAGFAELGETLEQACAREVLEESGVEVCGRSKVPPSALQYAESQPWPFPRSLMISFTAEVAPEEASAEQLQQHLSSEARTSFAEAGLLDYELEEYLGQKPPQATADGTEIKSVPWLHWQYISSKQEDWPQAVNWGYGVSPYADAQPRDSFHIPGASSLAHRMLQRWVARKAGDNPGACVPECQIDVGRFKYILLRVTLGASTKLLVRGSCSGAYHDDIRQSTVADLGLPDSAVECLGGGRIQHDVAAQCIAIYGHSMAFGPAVHEVSAAIVRRAFPFYPPGNITASYDGY